MTTTDYKNEEVDAVYERTDELLDKETKDKDYILVMEDWNEGKKTCLRDITDQDIGMIDEKRRGVLQTYVLCTVTFCRRFNKRKQYLSSIRDMTVVVYVTGGANQYGGLIRRHRKTEVN